VRPTLIDLKGSGLIAGTPNGVNDFATMVNWGNGGQPDWKSWHFTSYDNPYLDPKELDALKYTMTEREFRQEIMAEFLENDAAVFRNLEAAMMATYDEPALHKNHMMVGGVELGQKQRLYCTKCWMRRLQKGSCPGSVQPDRLLLPEAEAGEFTSEVEREAMVGGVELYRSA